MDDLSGRSNRIRQAIDARLSGVEAGPALEQKVLRTVRGEAKVKKKLSAGLVLVIVLILAAVTALGAALLKGKDFVDQVLTPMASRNASEKFTREELDVIARLARENGIQLSEFWENRLRIASGEYKDEVMRAFMKSEFGFYPDRWPVDVQYWHAQLMISLGFFEETDLCVPRGVELSQEQIADAAVAYLKASDGAGVELKDASTYARSMVFFENSQAPQGSRREWFIEYLPLGVLHARYTLWMLPDGTVLDKERIPSVEIDMTPETVQLVYTDMYGDMGGWTEEVFNTFLADIQRAAQKHPIADPALAELLSSGTRPSPQNTPAVIPQ